MGDPGAKTVLTLHNLCAELESFLRYRWGPTPMTDFISRLRVMGTIPSAWWRHFACSGDDHAAIGPFEYLVGISETHSANGMSVSWPQNFVSRVGGTYCEEMFFTRKYSAPQLFPGKRLWQMSYETHSHVDIVKLRLLSPCSKEHEGKDEPNPGIGKAHQISKVLAWLPAPLDKLKSWASFRWNERFSAHLPSGVERYLPVSLGGLEAPGWHLDPLNTIDELLDLGTSHQSLIKKLLTGTTSHLERRVLGSFASNARARGLEADLIQDQVRLFLANVELTKAIDVEQIQSVIDVDPDDFKNWNARKKFSAARAAGFISINDALNLIERPYIFRDLLFPDMSEKHGIVPRITEPYQSRPWTVRKRKFAELADNLVPAGEDIPLTATDIQSIAEAITSGFLLEVPPSNLLIPKDVVNVESRPTLQTPYHGVRTIRF